MPRLHRRRHRGGDPVSDRSAIEWTDATWNPVTGCTKVSPGCDHCYAETLAERFRGTPGHYYEHGFDVQLRPDKLDMPLRWKKPRRVFVNSMSDLFHEAVPDNYIAKVFAVMAAAPQHTFQVLTKRHGRMRSLLHNETFRELVFLATNLPHGDVLGDNWPIRNVWLGVSVENQKWADIRIPALLDTPASVRFLSCEPLLGPVRLRTEWLWGSVMPSRREQRIGWVIVGGESGRDARPMHPDWARSLRDQCTAAGVAFHFKQWGEWAPPGHELDDAEADRLNAICVQPDGEIVPWLTEPADSPAATLIRPGKRAAGRELDGRTWDEYPEVAS